MISILEAVQKVHEIDRAHDNAMRHLREWECARHERMEREFREHEARRAAEHKKCLEKFQRDIDATIRASLEQAARDKRDVEELLAEADDLIKLASSKHTRV